MTAIRSHHSRMFLHLLREHQAALVAALVAGSPEDHAAYRQIVGRIQGLEDAVRLSEEADFKISGEEPDAST